jgi:hypothetical protein
MPDAPAVKTAGLAVGTSEQHPQRLDGLVPTAEPEPSPQEPASVTRVRQTLVTSDGQQPISKAEALKGYEIEPDGFVAKICDEQNSAVEK